MNIFRRFEAITRAEIEALAKAGALPAGLDLSALSVDPPREAAHGDLSTNAAMVLAKPAGKPPRAIADLLAERLRMIPDVTEVTVAGPGFINLRLAPEVWRAELATLLRAGREYGKAAIGHGQAVNVEYVSANPTGPLHVGHARGTVVGDALANLLAFAGYRVTREYYINDAGAQVDALAVSAYARYLEALGTSMDEAAFARLVPGRDWAYRGEYLVPLGAALAAHHGRDLAGKNEAVWLPIVRDQAIAAMMALIREDLAALGVRHDIFSSERALVDAGAVDAAVKVLESRGLIYTGVLEPPKGKKPDDWEPRPQTLFRATQFGDEVDRPLKKSDGSWTYFATDLAYHFDKWRRGFQVMIDVWGADHGGYIKRMQAGVKALTEDAAALDVKICQLVKLLENGQPAKMSKRAGTFVTLRDLIEAVGKDVVRFIMLTRRNDASLDFDLVKAREQSRDNPVFYVQYAHARCRSVLRHAHELYPDAALDGAALASSPLARLEDRAEIGLIQVLAQWPRVVESAALAHEPHRIAFYLSEVAAAFHGLWTRGKDEAQLRFLIESDRPLTMARLALVEGVASIVAAGLSIMGVAPVEEMRE
ncbi:MAG: arginine--tRNA ligase [Alphaproteobacteria bacterium]|nr:arginine--tRNA ligase [Alphaproteobacteria bacterium]